LLGSKGWISVVLERERYAVIGGVNILFIILLLLLILRIPLSTSLQHRQSPPSLEFVELVTTTSLDR
jgi:hypothetical protein